MASNTIAQSSADRLIGPSLSMLQLSAIAPKRLTRPKVGRRPVTRQRFDGDTMEPSVSVPMAKPTKPAAVAEADPADDPDDPSSRFHGFFVSRPSSHTSPHANAPTLSL